MGSWYLSLVISVMLVLIGLYTHWLVIVLGALLPFVLVGRSLWQRRKPPDD